MKVEPHGESGLPKLVKPDEAASILGIALAELHSLVESAEIPAVILGPRWRIARDELLAAKQRLTKG